MRATPFSHRQQPERNWDPTPIGFRPCGRTHRSSFNSKKQELPTLME